ncbi:ABC transporter ATP-binding protein [Actinomadura decatromicini]|uniref:ABC transporter ATP-binding protein n=1 Tax=Actinomadura decatromicini TaxID=2604572 RepID=A0A5D3FMG4_9ACTN|nr:ABC transporter ATP-binding protein [Actinomadura decatromicini]TYK49324.1 ABC transporter ATP-binding protein [Actinomadura decatromicini]
MTADVQVSAEPAVRLSEVSKAFGTGRSALLALDRVSLDVAPGEFVCLVGASGCGKSTLLNLVAGLDRPSAGTIQQNTAGKDGKDGQGSRVALMFQEPALFPWLTVTGNLELALKMRGVPRAERRERAGALLDTVHLRGFAKKRPHQLSGGMRQRIALARALALTEQEHASGTVDAEEEAAERSTVLLMDEPFGALDAMTRDLLHDEIERIWRERRLTVLFVTHNVREAVRLGDRVVLLSSRPGRVVEEFPVPLERPRRIDAPEVAALAGTITDRLREEVGRHGA